MANSHILYSLDTINITDEERMWLENMGCRAIYQTSETQKQYLIKAINEIFQMPNVITIFNMSHIDNITTIRNIILEREQIKALCEQIVSNCKKELSKNLMALAKFCKPRFNDPVPLSVIKITQENVRDFREIIENE